MILLSYNYQNRIISDRIHSNNVGYLQIIAKQIDIDAASLFVKIFWMRI
jgi:hypothetical protein